MQRAGISENIIHKINGVEAFSYIETEAFPDLILLDIRMPQLDGFGFLDLLNNSSFPQKNKKCVFMLTSSSDEGDIEKAKSYNNVVDYLHKPFKTEYIELITK